MSLISLVAMTVIVGADTSGAPLDRLVARWDSECKTPTPDAADGCVALNAEIELGLYDLLHKLSLSREPIERDVLRSATQAHLPMLARMGVSLLGAPKGEEDADALLVALDHPSLAVRHLAARALDDAHNPTWLTLKPWAGATLDGANAPEDSLIPDPKPLPSQFEMMSFNGLTYHYYGSDKEKAMFTTSEPVQSLVARLQKKRKVLKSMDALQQQMDAIQPEMDSIMQEMQDAGAANDQARVAKAMQRMQELNGKMGNIQTLTQNPLAESYTVLLAMDAKQKRPTITLVVQRVASLNRTVLVFWKEGGWR